MFHDTIINLFFFCVISLVIFLIIKKNISFFANSLYLIDNNIQSKNTPLLGGVFLSLALLIIYIILLVNSNKNYFHSEFVYVFAIFVLGAFDDAKNIRAVLRLLFSALIVFFIIQTNEVLIVNFLYIDKFYILNNHFSIFFTILCFLLFQNALNLMDGVNCLVLSFCLLILIILLLVDQNHFEIKLSLIITSIYLLYLNYKNITFLGDSGVYTLSFIISIFTIEAYKYNYQIFDLADILILFSLPGYDMFRLFVQRTINKKHPFTKDNNHLHHFLIAKSYGPAQISIIYLFVTILLFSLNYFFNLSFVISVILSVIFYLLILNYAKN
jgi:UDP-GlcNAc:undecaprenyl-phosphate/decaprenyl-phosphate GlcNAc-1-phosphate transferase